MSDNIEPNQMMAQRLNGSGQQDPDSFGDDGDPSVHFDAKLMAMARYQALPAAVKRRVRALKKLQFAHLQERTKFYEELHELERRYLENTAPQAERRRDIVAGDVEPTDEDADWPEEAAEAEAALAGLLKDKMQVVAEEAKGNKKEEAEAEETKKKKEEEEAAAAAAAGVPEFWLTAMKNIEMLAQMIQKQDEPVLRQLRDITVRLFAAGSEAELPGFELLFHFNDNEYFTNKTLSKKYYLRQSPDPKLPWDFDGPEIIRCEGCDILWRKGKNVTVKTVKKVQKHKTGGQKRTITKTVETDSFFNFFNPPVQSIEDLGDEEGEEDTENLLQADFEIAHFLKEQFVPRAVLYFTGDALEDEEDDEEDEDDLDEEEDEDDDDEDSDTGGRGGASGNAGGNKQQECKQQ